MSDDHVKEKYIYLYPTGSLPSLHIFYIIFFFTFVALLSCRRSRKVSLALPSLNKPMLLLLHRYLTWMISDLMHRCHLSWWVYLCSLNLYLSFSLIPTSFVTAAVFLHIMSSWSFILFFHLLIITSHHITSLHWNCIILIVSNLQYSFWFLPTQCCCCCIAF